MTEQQYERWRDFALRMARTCYRSSRRPSAKWIEGVVVDFFDRFDECDIPCIVDWDHSTEYPEGNPCHGREHHLSYCGCGGYRHSHDGNPDPECEECHGSGLYHALFQCGFVCDSMSEFLYEYEPATPRCRSCESDVVYWPESDTETGRVRYIGRIPGDGGVFCDPGCDCPNGHVSKFEAQDCPKWIKKREAMCQCDEIEQAFGEQWDEQWGGPVRCCVRAGLDCASAPSAGVVGFTAGDVRRMYPEGVPDWVFPADERLQYWLSDELNGTFAELPDSAGVVL